MLSSFFNNGILLSLIFLLSESVCFDSVGNSILSSWSFSSCEDGSCNEILQCEVVGVSVFERC